MADHLHPSARRRGYDFSAETRFDRLFAGVAYTVPSFIPKGVRTGSEHLKPEDTSFDIDYGRLPEAAYARKGSRARQDSNLRPPA